jgi:putative ABC transport system permease protein
VLGLALMAAPSLFAGLFFHEAVRAIARNKTRSALTALGITVGIAAVVCVVAIGSAGAQRAEEQLANLGDNLVWVEAGSRNVNGVRTGAKGMTTLTVSDAEAIRHEVGHIKSVSPHVDSNIQLAFGNRNWGTRYRGVSADYLDIKRWEVAEGAPFTDQQVIEGAAVCLIGQTVRTQLFGPEEAVGKVIRMANQLCQVVGVLAAKGSSAFGQDQDDTILLPYTAAQQRLRGRGYEWLDDVMCAARSFGEVESAVTDITSLLRQRHGIAPGQPDDFNIRRPDEVIKAQIEASRSLALLLIGIASVALLVGGIGIMNVMLVSVTERTREIGVRLAVGATEGAVQLQFLGEAVVLSMVGGVGGVVVGVASSYVLARSLDWPVSIPAQVLIVAPAFAIGVGVFFGYYPARKASRLDPIMALRNE